MARSPQHRRSRTLSQNFLTDRATAADSYAPPAPTPPGCCSKSAQGKAR